MVKDDKTLWQSCAKAYDGMLNIIPYRNLLLEVVDISNIGDHMRVLDICCGTGNLLWALQQRRVSSHVTGLDYTDKMLEQANIKKAQYSGVSEFIEADINEPFEKWQVSGKFNRLVCNNAMYMLADPAEALRKFGALAADRAELVITTPLSNPSSHAIIDEHLRLAEASGIGREEALQWLTPRLQPLLECSTIILERYSDAIHSPNRAGLKEWFKDSGWTITEIRTIYAGQNWLITAVKD